MKMKIVSKRQLQPVYVVTKSRVYLSIACKWRHTSKKYYINNIYSLSLKGYWFRRCKAKDAKRCKKTRHSEEAPFRHKRRSSYKDTWHTAFCRHEDTQFYREYTKSYYQQFKYKMSTTRTIVQYKIHIDFEIWCFEIHEYVMF